MASCWRWPPESSPALPASAAPRSAGKGSSTSSTRARPVHAPVGDELEVLPGGELGKDRCPWGT